MVQSSTQAATMSIQCIAADISRDSGAPEGDARKQQRYKKQKKTYKIQITERESTDKMR